MSGLGKSSKICAVILANEIGIGNNSLFFSVKKRLILENSNAEDIQITNLGKVLPLTKLSKKFF